MRVLLAEIFETNPQTLKQLWRDSQRQRQRRQSVRQASAKGLADVDKQPPKSNRHKGQNGEQRVRKVKQAEDNATITTLFAPLPNANCADDL